MNLFPLICTRANSSWNVILSCTGLSSWNGLTSWNLPLINFNALESFDYPEFDEGYVPFCLSQSISETQFDRFQRVFFHITIFSNLTKIGPNPPPPPPDWDGTKRHPCSHPRCHGAILRRRSTFSRGGSILLCYTTRI